MEEVAAINALPEFAEDGVDVDIDPELAHDGGIGAGEGTTVTIVAARWGKFMYQNRTDIPAEMRLFVSLKREGYDNPREESLKYGEFSRYNASKDGMFVKLRPSAIKKNKDGSDYVPRPYKYNQGVMFLQSLKDAGLSVTKLNSDGLKSIIGLTVHVRRRKVAGQSETGRPALIVDYIDGVTAPAGTTVSAGTTAPAANTQTPAAPKGQTVNTPSVFAPAQPAAASVAPSEVDGLAIDALIEIIGQGNGKISRSQVAAGLIRIVRWKTHKNRGEILALLRDDSFINRDGQIWKVSGNELSL